MNACHLSCFEASQIQQWGAETLVEYLSSGDLGSENPQPERDCFVIAGVDLRSSSDAYMMFPV